MSSPKIEKKERVRVAGPILHLVHHTQLPSILHFRELAQLPLLIIPTLLLLLLLLLIFIFFIIMSTQTNLHAPQIIF
jgi:hypothetical protein